MTKKLSILQEEIDNLPPINQVLKDHGFYTKKNLGQNFIFDLNVTNKIVSFAKSLEDSLVIEVGPGAGSLTRAILYHNPDKLIAIEKDERCLEILSKLKNISEDKIEIINEDALKIKYHEILRGYEGKTKVIANLPYNVGTELLMIWLEKSHLYSSLTLMFQKEVAERVTANVNEKHYSRLSVISSLTSKCSIAFEVPPTIFYPPPKVYSAIVHLEPYQKPLYDVDLVKLKKVTKAAFGQKRKAIRNPLKSIFGADTNSILEELGIDGSLRAENISPELYAKLSKKLQIR